MDVIYTAAATAGGGARPRVQTADGILDLEIRTPKDMGGPGGPYTNPEQLFAAGYSACFASAIHYVAMKKRKRIESSVTVVVNTGKHPGGGFMYAVKLDIEISGIDQKEAISLVHEAHGICPYSNAIRGNVELTYNVVTR